MNAPRWARLLEAGGRERIALLDACRDPRAAQRVLLQRILAENAASGFGREHGFDAIDGLDDYRRRVPIRDYAGLEPWIDRICAGERDALTTAPVFVLEQTGGGGGARKLVPYAQGTIAAFQRGVLAWLADLCRAFPDIGLGRAYFAISPATRQRPEPIGGLPVGLGSDAAYFGEEFAADVGAILVGDGAIAATTELEDWRQRTLHHLAAADDLTFVSVWSPTFFSMLLDAIESDPEALVRALRDGAPALPPKPERAALLQRSLANGGLNVKTFWPRLELVSAWADASSASFARQLKARLGDVGFQPKGLLATEGIFTLPLHGSRAPMPALTSTFLEFEAPGGELLLIDQLREGDAYDLVVTTPGGFYRYRIGDRVLCIGHHREDGCAVPLLRFLGRTGGVLDLVGEKLDEAFVADCLERLATFATLAPADGARPAYRLIVEGDEVTARGAAAQVDEALRRNPLYADARDTGQLGDLQTVPVSGAFASYVEWRLAKGHRLGDVKVPALLSSWATALEIWPAIAQRC